MAETENKVEFGQCKICGGPTYNVNGGPFLCKVFGCPAHYTPQNFFVKVRTNDGEEGYILEYKVTADMEIIEEEN